VSYDPDLYGPPERGNEDPEQDDDWEALLEAMPGCSAAAMVHGAEGGGVLVCMKAEGHDGPHVDSMDGIAWSIDD